MTEETTTSTTTTTTSNNNSGIDAEIDIHVADDEFLEEMNSEKTSIKSLSPTSMKSPTNSLSKSSSSTSTATATPSTGKRRRLSDNVEEAASTAAAPPAKKIILKKKKPTAPTITIDIDAMETTTTVVTTPTKTNGKSTKQTPRLRSSAKATKSLSGGGDNSTPKVKKTVEMKKKGKRNGPKLKSPPTSSSTDAAAAISPLAPAAAVAVTNVQIVSTVTAPPQPPPPSEVAKSKATTKSPKKSKITPFNNSLLSQPIKLEAAEFPDPAGGIKVAAPSTLSTIVVPNSPSATAAGNVAAVASGGVGEKDISENVDPKSNLVLNNDSQFSQSILNTDDFEACENDQQESRKQNSPIQFLIGGLAPGKGLEDVGCLLKYIGYGKIIKYTPSQRQVIVEVEDDQHAKHFTSAISNQVIRLREITYKIL